MAIYAGKDGYFKMKVGSGTEAKVGYINNYSLNVNSGTAEATSMGDEWQQRVSTIKSWNGSASGALDTSDANQLAILNMFTGSATQSAVELKFGLGGTATYGGNAEVSGFTINADVGGVIQFTFNFEGDGALTFTAGA